MTREFVLSYFAGLKKVIDRIPIRKFEEIIELILCAYQQEKQIFIMGNGGSASTASHFACDVNKGVSFGLKKRFKVICLNDNVPTVLAYANDISYEDIFIEQLKNFLKPGDIVIGISGSGNSRNVLKAFKYANNKRAKTIGLTGFDGGKLAKLAHVSLIVPINDMQKVEDMHLILSHLIMQTLCQKIKKLK